MKTIEKFMDWLKRQKFWKVLLLALGFNFIWNFIVVSILFLSGAEFSQHVADTKDLFFNSLFFLPITTLSALLEEIIFRWGPMLILSYTLLWMYKSGRLSKERFFEVEKYAILALVIVSSIVFGWVHGNFWNVFLQGVSGVCFMLIYLRVLFIRRDEGLRNRWQMVPLAETTLAHTLSNSILMII